MIKRRAPKPQRRPRGVRYRDDEWAIIVARAKAEGISPSTFIREVSVRVARSDLAGADEGLDP